MEFLKKMKNWQMYSLAAIIVGLILYYSFRDEIDAKIQEWKGDEDEAGGLEPEKVQLNLLLKKGSRNVSVGELQRRMNSAGLVKKLRIDNDFGKKTEAALLQLTNLTETTLNGFSTNVGTVSQKPYYADSETYA